MVALPLVFDILLLSVLFNIVSKTEADAQRADHARELGTKAEAIFERLTEAALALTPNSRNQMVLGYRSIPPRIREDVQVFKSECMSPAEQKIASEVEDFSNRILLLLEEDRVRLQNNSLEFPAGLNGTRQQMTGILKRVKSTLEKVNSEEMRQRFTRSMQESRSQLKWALIAGFLCNVLLALSLTIFFNRGTTQRLNALMRNTLSLARGQPLAPPIGGSDEIGKLDETFHEMAQKLKETDRMKAEFTAMVSHDLRSPLATMHTFLDMITTDFYGSTPPAERKQAEKIQVLLDRLLALIDDILSFEKMEAGDIPLSLSEVAVQDVIDESIHSVSAAANSANVSFEVNCDAPDIMADQQKLTRAITNLLANAIKYSPQGEKVSIKASKNEEQHSVSVEIRDCGPGVSDEQKEIIFEKFRQAASPQTKEGIGLGLAICRKIIEQHGGKIGVKDADGGGSVFWLELPIEKKIADDASIKAEVVA